jgi:ABC-type transport system involved in multi-copper enzyme maturation permease subunit
MASDRRNLALIALTAPLLGVLIWVVLPSGELGPLPAGQIRLVSQAPLVLFVLVVGVTQLGASVSAREIVKEQGVFRRERAKGLSISAYVASKAVVLGLVVAFQAVALTVLATAGQNGPTGASALGWPLGELIVVVFLVGLAGATSGLLVSALSDTSDQAMTIVPVVVIVQLLLASGGVFPSITEKPVIREATYASSTRWGFDAAASTSSLNQIAGLNRVAAELPSIDLREPEKALEVLLDTDRGNPAWNHEADTWWRSVAAIATLAAAGLLATGLALRRKDPL